MFQLMPNARLNVLMCKKEAGAGLTLLNILEEVSGTLRFNGTTRSSIEENWVSIVLRFSNDTSFDIFMTVEEQYRI